MRKEINFTLHLESIDSVHYWGYISEIPHLSRVVGESFLDVGCQLVAQLSYMIHEMPDSWHIDIRTEMVLTKPLRAA